MSALSGKTDQLTVTDATPTEIVAQTQCNRIAVGEDPSVSGWPTSNFLVMKPAPTDDPREIPMGVSYIFERTGGAYLPGTVVGYIQTVSGTTTFFQDESL